MAQIDITINGRIYKITCAEGQEAHVGRLGHYVDRKVGELVKSVDQPVDVRILLMASLLIADELAEAEEKLKNLPAQNAATKPSEHAPPDNSRLVSTIDALTDRIHAIAAELEADYV